MIHKIPKFPILISNASCKTKLLQRKNELLSNRWPLEKHAPNATNI